jgi:DNA processing protein
VREPSACVECLRRGWLLLALAPYIERANSATPGSRAPELLALGDERLAATVAPKAATRLLASADLPEARLREQVRSAGAWSVCRHDDRFPSGLADAPDGPRGLFAVGDPDRLADLRRSPVVTVVGARRASGYGRQVAERLGRDLAAAGAVVVSGMAFGIDGAAHRGALEGGRTVAVLGCGADVAYPAAHRALHRAICRDGLVLSELPPGASAWRWAFPARNRVMAALGQMTVVVEGAERSGSLITAQQAEDLGRDVGAVPGPVTSAVAAGPNGLLAAGAHVIRDAQDALDAVLGPGMATIERSGPPLEPGLLAALHAVERGEGASVSALALGRLELLGYVECSPLGAYSRTLLAAPRS